MNNKKSEPIIPHMSIKTVAIILVILLLVAGLFKFLSSQRDKHTESSNFVEKSVKAIKRVEVMQEERAKTILEQERELDSWE